MTTSRRKRLLALTGTLLVVLPISAVAANWQWNRHLAREARNVLIQQAINIAPVSYPGPLSDGYQAADEFRRVSVTGQWHSESQRFVRKTVVDGAVGFGVVAPFLSETGELLFVKVGWVRNPTTIALPSSDQTITVRMYVDQESGPMRPADLPAAQINWVNPAELANGRPFAPAVFDLIEPVPAGLTAMPEPRQSSGPHVGYTIHWILIGVAAIIIYVRLLRSEFQPFDAN